MGLVDYYLKEILKKSPSIKTINHREKIWVTFCVALLCQEGSKLTNRQRLMCGPDFFTPRHPIVHKRLSFPRTRGASEEQYFA